MTKLSYNPFSAKSILFTVFLALAAYGENEDVEFLKDAESEDAEGVLEAWEAGKLHKKIGSPKVPSPLLIHAIFNDKWQKAQSEFVDFGFVATYMDLDKAKAVEIQGAFLIGNKSMDSLATLGRVLEKHPLHVFWEDENLRSDLLMAEVAEDEAGQFPVATVNVDETKHGELDGAVVDDKKVDAKNVSTEAPKETTTDEGEATDKKE